MDMIVSGKVYKLDGYSGSESRDVRNYGVSETVMYKIQDDFLLDIASSNGVKFRVTGSKRIIERCLTKERAAFFEEVVEIL